VAQRRQIDPSQLQHIIPAIIIKYRLAKVVKDRVAVLGRGVPRFLEVIGPARIGVGDQKLRFVKFCISPDPEHRAMMRHDAARQQHMVQGAPICIRFGPDL
jgi:hypothetical protein